MARRARKHIHLPRHSLTHWLLHSFRVLTLIHWFVAAKITISFATHACCVISLFSFETIYLCFTHIERRHYEGFINFTSYHRTSADDIGILRRR
jgi:hypothetical protein